MNYITFKEDILKLVDPKDRYFVSTYIDTMSLVVNKYSANYMNYLFFLHKMKG